MGMDEKVRYGKNLELFARLYPLDAYRLETLDCENIAFCRTKEGELNLVDTSRGHDQPFYFHSQEGAHWEARRWRAAQTFDSVDILYIYGIGLGYYYLVLKDWLKEDRKRHVVFIEGDPRVVRCFLETELATEILNHRQVHIWLLTSLRERKLDDDESFSAYDAQIGERIFTFAERTYRIFALQSYFVAYFTFFDILYRQLCLNLSHIQLWLDSYREEESFLVAQNFYTNIFRISEAVPASKMAEELRGIPTILCGAGPSLTKHLPLLNTLKNQAIIVSSGSATNALGAAKVIPHFAGGLDPYPIQESRLLTHSASKVPLIYINRYYGKALQKWRGPLIYTVTTSVKSLIGDMGIIEWFEKQLNILSQEKLSTGYTTSNFLLDALRYFGSDPVILIGMDLAYTNQRRYATGVSTEPEIIVKNTLLVPCIDGSTVETRIIWCLEAAHIDQLKKKYPSFRILNATEGGMIVVSTPNVKFKETISEHLHDFGDIEGWIHGVIQNCVKDRVSSESVMTTIYLWKSSLNNSLNYLNSLQQDLRDNKKRLENGERLPYGTYTGRASLWLVELENEVIYEPLLRQLELEFDRLYRYQQLVIQKLPSGIRKQKQQLNYIMRRYEHLIKYAQEHFSMLCTALEEHEAIQNERIQSEKRYCHPPNYIKDKKMEIIEPSLGLNIVVDFHPPMISKDLWPKATLQNPVIVGLQMEKNGLKEGQTLYFYPNGAIKAEAFFKQGRLHGPWSFYGADGVLLAKSWFVEGQKQGKACYYNCIGDLYAEKMYCDGLEQELIR